MRHPEVQPWWHGLAGSQGQPQVRRRVVALGQVGHLEAVEHLQRLLSPAGGGKGLGNEQLRAAVRPDPLGKPVDQVEQLLVASRGVQSRQALGGEPTVVGVERGSACKERIRLFREAQAPKR